jgi:hypothetical protein
MGLNIALSDVSHGLPPRIWSIVPTNGVLVLRWIEIVTVTNLARCSDKWCAGPCGGSNLLLSRIWPGVLTNGVPVRAIGQTCYCHEFGPVF